MSGPVFLCVYMLALSAVVLCIGRWEAERTAPAPDRSPGYAFLRTMTLRRPDRLVYLWRLRIAEVPLTGLYLHRITAADWTRDVHDHPWGFVAFVFRGSYTERVLDTRTGAVTFRRVRWFNFKRASRHAHAITSVDGPVWTLVIRGPRKREWGFWRDDREWVPHGEYEKDYPMEVSA